MSQGKGAKPVDGLRVGAHVPVTDPATGEAGTAYELGTIQAYNFTTDKNGSVQVYALVVLDRGRFFVANVRALDPFPIVPARKAKSDPD